MDSKVVINFKHKSKSDIVKKWLEWSVETLISYFYIKIKNN